MSTPEPARLKSKALAYLALTLAVAAAGGAAFAAVDLPAGWLSGAMIAVAVAALFGLSADVPRRLRDLVFLILGVSMGAGVTPDVVEQLPTWPVSLAGLAVTMILVTAASYVYLRRVAGWDPASAYFGSIPGALTMTLAVAEASPADLRLVSLAQTIRLFMLVAVLPLVVASIESAPPAHTLAGAIDDPLHLAGLMAAGIAGAAIGVATGFPSGLLLGSFVASSALHGFSVVDGQIPAFIQAPAFVVLGAMLGLRFSGTGWRQLRAMLVAGVGAFSAAMSAAVAGAVAVATLAGRPLGQVLVAFAPGGLEAMVILAFVLAVDPAFVAAHHLARFLAMTFVVPVVAPFVYGRTAVNATKDTPRT
ncbi:MAG TPA: AbrB family transcriptional regulator [Methylomirabilota bacterium]|nr:AbrB family transcriptional regulator [Methylomirabilota bacterium]